MLLDLKYTDKIIIIDTDEIYYITKNGQYISIKFRDKTIEHRGNLYNIHYLLPKDSFIRCHKSFIVNVKKILSINTYSNTTYNVKFRDINDEIYMSRKSLKDLNLILRRD